MIEIIVIAVLGTGDYAGIHYHLWKMLSSIKEIKIINSDFSKTFDRARMDFEKERAEFIVEKTVLVAKTAGVLCRICSVCGRVVNKYETLENNIIICIGCEGKK